MANIKQEMAWEETSSEYVNEQENFTHGKKNEMFLNSSQKMHQKFTEWKVEIIVNHKEIYSTVL